MILSSALHFLFLFIYLAHHTANLVSASPNFRLLFKISDSGIIPSPLCDRSSSSEGT